MDIKADFFSLFGLPRIFRIDLDQLEKQYREIQIQVHPDRFVNAGDRERRFSLQWATRANEAYLTLKKPLERARYLLMLSGVDVQAESNTAMASEFLIEQMEWREQVMEIRSNHDHEQLEQLFDKLRLQLQREYDLLATQLDDEVNFMAATEQVRRLMFLEKLLLEIEDALAFFEDRELDT